MFENENHTQDNKVELQCWKTTFDLFQLTGTLVSNHTERVRVITNIFENENKELKHQFQNKDDEIKSLQAKLSGELTTVNNHITPEQEKLFTFILKQKQKLSKSNIIQAKNVHGRSISLGVLRRAKIGSSSASKSTVRCRSQQTEAFQLVSSVCSTSNKDSVTQKNDLVTQKASLIKRQKELYLSLSNKAGLTLMKNFKLDAQTVLGFKQEMPLSMWKLIKRGLNDSLGVDIMGTETELRKYLNDHGNFEHECWTVIIQNKKIHFFRVTDVADLL